MNRMRSIESVFASEATDAVCGEKYRLEQARTLIDLYNGLRRPETMADMKDLEPLAKKLNAASDVLNAALQTIEWKLNAMGVGIEVFLESDPLKTSAYEQIGDGPDRQFWVDELGYGRYGDVWALLVRSSRCVEGLSERGFPETTSYDVEEKPLLKAARALRVAAVPLLPSLIEAIESAAGEMLASVEQAKKIADSLK